MNIKVNIATKEIELLDSVPFEDVKKLVNMFIAGYGWDEKEVRIKSKAELMPLSSPIVVKEPWYFHYKPYEVLCGGAQPIGVTRTMTISGENEITGNFTKSIPDGTVITYTAMNT